MIEFLFVDILNFKVSNRCSTIIAHLKIVNRYF